jgi:hypothetical protein
VFTVSQPIDHMNTMAAICQLTPQPLKIPLKEHISHPPVENNTTPLIIRRQRMKTSSGEPTYRLMDGECVHQKKGHPKYIIMSDKKTLCQ